MYSSPGACDAATAAAAAAVLVGDLGVTPVEVHHLPRVLLLVPHARLLRLAGVGDIVPMGGDDDTSN